jgi:hypothetical protein
MNDLTRRPLVLRADCAAGILPKLLVGLISQAEMVAPRQIRIYRPAAQNPVENFEQLNNSHTTQHAKFQKSEPDPPQPCVFLGIFTNRESRGADFWNQK